MTIVLKAAFFICLLDCLCLGSLSADERRAIPFPFEVIVDENSGYTGDYPNRVNIESIDLWLVFVPAGDYSIGHKTISDSMQLTVTQSGFYISEDQATYEQVARYAVESVKRQLEEIYAEIPQEEIPLHNLYKEVTQAFIITSINKLLWNSEEVFQAEAEFSRLYRLDNPKPRDREKPVLTEATRRAFVNLENTFEAQVQKMKNEGSKSFEKAYYHLARSFADTWKLDLPTEAQWEIAAKLNASKQIKLYGLHDEILEWCSDFYAFDYYHRTGDRINPKGPTKGKFSDDQLKAETPESGLEIVTREYQLAMKVLRGRGISERTYGYNGGGTPFSLYTDPFRRNKGIRLVYNVEG